MGFRWRSTRPIILRSQPNFLAGVGPPADTTAICSAPERRLGKRRDTMRLKAFSLLASASLFGLLAGLPMQALAQAVALTGQVTSAEEGPMEGVVVSAKKQGSTITVAVVTDAKGQYSFPANRLDTGPYAISIRAAGYDLDGPKTADVAAG